VAVMGRGRGGGQGRWWGGGGAVTAWDLGGAGWDRRDNAGGLEMSGRCGTAGGIGRQGLSGWGGWAMTWMVERSENDIENKVLYD
jgi:hypothetical protein